MSAWNSRDALKLYNIPYWGNGYFDVNESGEVFVKPRRDKAATINLPELCKHLSEQGVALPTLVRFTDILHDRVSSLCQAFQEAIQYYKYRAQYTAVYPIKVNQQQQVVEGILAGQKKDPSVTRVGLEAGSKPELMAVLALSENTNSSVIICNGYKDREYIRLALIGEALGHQVYIVIEKVSELDVVLEEARRLQVTPRLGLRARLASQSKGKWQTSGGEKSKFGLSAHQILQVVERLRKEEALDSLQLLHFHLGSQVANIRDIQTGLRECARFYAELRQLGAPISVVDVGGGLGVDYEGTRSQSTCSINYSMSEYASNVVYAMAEVCAERNLPHPNIVSESGRALTAHHAVLLANVIDVESPKELQPPRPGAADPKILHALWESYQEALHSADERNVVEIYHDTIYDVAEVQSLYTHGLLSLTERAKAEQIYQAICMQIRPLLSHKNRAHREIIDELHAKLADKLFVNFSVFQSLPDVWGIDQVFPVLPISGLDKEPTFRAVVQDITCDSDGTIDQYVDGQGIETTLPVPEFDPANPYVMGFFLVGAYQEILGDMHNLFGDTHSVDVSVDEAGEWEVSKVLMGDTVDQILAYVNFDSRTFVEAYRRQLTKSSLSSETQAECLAFLEEGLAGYTYLEE
ncbi:biosynthetic arginine decarboxylase [Pokkaliibacter sp. MBI-7]|uniref:biosynthetic arginine decarboxylase n=1 Tax=Pokkaliibacter sp. MBI-7 TaxID=3040600 RepID=UPI0024488758|nr:biosynthetic arginine decarboxylase [Pokkaliibacter sp. MBI-7]MDH2433548.1 biosynthetic arginine decarboxylase [Pokkaliibacter sp. MBI-7]